MENKLKSLKENLNKARAKYVKAQIKFNDEFSKNFVENFNNKKETTRYYASAGIIGYMKLEFMENSEHTEHDGENAYVFVKMHKTDKWHRVKIKEITVHE